jgi:signal transduction histidine kinase
MKQEEKVVWQHHSPEYARSFLQPLAVAIVSAIVIGLIVIMGIVDLRRSDKTLQDFMNNQVLGIMGVVQRLAQENLNNLLQVHRKLGEPAFVPLSEEEVFSPEKWLTTALSDLGRDIDNTWKANKLDRAYLKKFADDKGLWLVAVLNRKGAAVFQSRPLTADLFPGESGSVRERKITIENLSELGKQKKLGFVALRRKDGSGTVIIALDRDGLRYWSMKVSVEKAIDKLGQGQGQGMVYLAVTDLRGMPLGQTGQAPEKLQQGDMNLAPIIAGKLKLASRKVVFKGKNVLDMTAPLYLNNKVMGITRIGLAGDDTDRILAENRRNIFMFTGFIVVTALLSMWLLYHNQNRHLAGIVEMERQLEKAGRLSALGQLAAGVGHEIRNPLNAISMASQRLVREFTPVAEDKAHDFQVLASVIRDEIRRLNGIIEEFLTFAKSRRLELHDYPVTEVLQKIVNLIREEAVAKGISIETHWTSPPTTIPMDMDKLQQALLNLVKNAMESITGKGVITIAAGQKDRERIGIRISDTGCGMTAEEVERIFNPEYTTKEKGLGLGLPLAHEIIRGHGGEIRVLSRQGEGTTFEVILPVAGINGRTESSVKYA